MIPLNQRRVLAWTAGFALLASIALAVSLIVPTLRISEQRRHDAETDGKRFGETHADGDCVIEALSRQARGMDNRSALESSAFITGCLNAARITEQFCDGVPQITDLAARKEWMDRQCDRVDHAESCRVVWTGVTAECAGRQRF